MIPIFLNGTYGTSDDMKVSVLDRGYLFGDGVYEAYRVYGHRPFTRDLHLARLDRSLEALELSLPYARDEFLAILDRMETISPAEVCIYIQITRGVAPRHHAFPEVTRPSLMVMPMVLGPFVSEMFQRGVALSSHPDERWLHCDFKSLNLLANCMAITRAVRQGSFETLLVGADGLVNESGYSSFFAVLDGVLYTAPLSRNILPGITRQVLLELAREHGLAYREEAVTLDQVYAAQEAFVSNSIYEVLPVATVDKRAIGASAPGPLTKQLMALFAAKVQAETGQRAPCLAGLDGS